MASYLTKNRKGTYVFQMRVPKHIVHTYPNLNPTIWYSLRTKDRSEAEKRAGGLWVMFDQLSERFSDPKRNLDFDQEIMESLHHAIDEAFINQTVMHRCLYKSIDSVNENEREQVLAKMKR